MLYGRTTTNIASRFLDEIPPSCVRKEGAAKPRYEEKHDYGTFGRASIYGDYDSYPSTQSAKPRQVSKDYSAFSSATKKKTPAISFQKGDMVQHKAFGRGMVLTVLPMGGDALLEIAFDNVGTKRLMANTASQHMTKI